MKATILISTFSLALLPSILVAEGPPPKRPTPPVIEALDQDADGVISEDEINAASESLATLDKNEDGELTPDELRPPRPEKADPPPEKRRRKADENKEDGRRPIPPIMRALDRNLDGTLSEREIKRAKRALAKLDRDGDDELTRHELEPPHGGPGADEEGERQGPPSGGGGRPPRGGGGR